MRALIIGGGIGGLTAAIALDQLGIEAHVYEQAPVLREVGAGITLWANAVNPLLWLGFGDALRARGGWDGQGMVRSSSGAILQRAAYDEIAKRIGVALILLHRGDLQSMLSERVDPLRLHLNHRCSGFRQDASGVTAQFENGEEAHGDILIGADGLNSVIRARLFGSEPPRYSGYTGWRTVVHAKLEHRVISESWGRGQRFGIAPLADGRVYWYATHNGPPQQKAPNGQEKQMVQALFRGWHKPIEDLIDAAEPASVLRNDIYDRNPLNNWTRNRATLLGDAAHPMTPNLGQGACQAIEDAVVLAVCVKNSANIDKALRDYQHRRIARTSAIVLRARRIGAMGQLENPLLCLMRNQAMRLSPPSVVLRQLQSVAEFAALTPAERALFKS